MIINNKFKKIVILIGKGIAAILMLYGLLQAILGLKNMWDNYRASKSCKNEIIGYEENSNTSINLSSLSDETLYKNINQINTGATNQYINNLFGNPFLIRRLPKCFNEWDKNPTRTGLEQLTERIYKDNRFYLQTVSENNTIIAYSITTRKKDFNPSIPLSVYKSVKDGEYIPDSGLKLLDATFKNLDNYEPERRGFISWNQHEFYLQHNYFGRPGEYKEYLFEVSPYGYHNEDVYEKMYELDFAYRENNNKVLNSKEFFEWLSLANINTFTVIYAENDITKKLLNYFFYYGAGPVTDIIYNL